MYWNSCPIFAVIYYYNTLTLFPTDNVYRLHCLYCFAMTPCLGRDFSFSLLLFWLRVLWTSIVLLQGIKNELFYYYLFYFFNEWFCRTHLVQRRLCGQASGSGLWLAFALCWICLFGAEVRRVWWTKYCKLWHFHVCLFLLCPLFPRKLGKSCSAGG